MTEATRASGRELPRIHVRPPGPASAAMAKRLHEVESRNVTFVSEHWPVFWTEAVGANVLDADLLLRGQRRGRLPVVATRRDDG